MRVKSVSEADLFNNVSICIRKLELQGGGFAVADGVDDVDSERAAIIVAYKSSVPCALVGRSSRVATAAFTS